MAISRRRSRPTRTSFRRRRQLPGAPPARRTTRRASTGTPDAPARVRCDRPSCARSRAAGRDRSRQRRAGARARSVGSPSGAHDEGDERERSLRDCLIELRSRGAGRTQVPDVADDTHNRHPRAIVVEAHAASDRILSGPLVPRQRLVDEHDRRRVARVAEAEVAAGLDRDAHRVEVAGHHDLIPRMGHRLRLRPALDQVAGAKVVAADWQRHGRASGTNAWHRPQSFEHVRVELDLARLILRSRTADADVERQQVACVDAGVDAVNATRLRISSVEPRSSTSATAISATTSASRVLRERPDPLARALPSRARRSGCRATTEARG